MYLCTYSLLGQTIIALVNPVLAKMYGPYAFAFIKNFVKYALLFGLYFGTVVVLYSIAVIKVPEYYNMGTPPVSLPVQAMMLLLFQYFAVYLILAVVRTYTELNKHSENDIRLLAQGGSNGASKLGIMMTNIETMTKASMQTLELIPLLAVLFIAARFRAVEVRPDTGAVQGWAGDCMFLVAYSLLIMAIMCAIIPYYSGELIDLEFEKALTDVMGEGNGGKHHGAGAAMANARREQMKTVLKERERQRNLRIAKALTGAKQWMELLITGGTIGVCVSIVTIGP